MVEKESCFAISDADAADPSGSADDRDGADRHAYVGGLSRQ